MEKVKLGQLTNIKTGRLDVNAENPNGKYPFFTCSKNHTYIDEYAFDGESVLVAGNGDLNVKYYNGKFNAYQRTYVIQANENLNGKFLYYFLDSYIEKLREQSIGGVIKYIKLGNLTDAEIPLPNLATQQRIAAILDQADAIIQNNRAIVQKYDALTQSLFLDMFGDFRKNSNNFPKYLFDEIATKITDGDHLTPKREEKGYKLLSCRNIKNGYIDFSAGLDFVGESEFNRMFKRCNPEKGDILISCSGTIGRTTSIKIDEPFVLVRSAALVKPKRDLVDSLYLEYYLRTDYMQSVMKKSSNTSSQANLFTGPIKKLPIFLPPFKLQKQFAERVVVIEEQKQQAQLELSKSEELFKSLLQRAFNGELN